MRRKWIHLTAALFSLGLFALPTASLAGEVLVVRTADKGPYRKAEAGFMAEFGKSVSALAEPNAAEVKSALASGATLVFAIGPGAAKVVRELNPSVPAVYAVVPNPESIGLSDRGRVIPMFAPAAQFEAVRGLLPSAKKVGILYNPAFSNALLKDYREAASAAGISLLAEAVSAEKDVAVAARNLLGRVDALCLIPDPTVGGRPETFEFLVRTSLELKVPLIAYSESMSQKGALLSVEASYQDMGKKAAVLAKRLLAGEAGAAERPTSDLFLNAKTADQLGIRIPDAFRKRVAKVYE